MKRLVVIFGVLATGVFSSLLFLDKTTILPTENQTVLLPQAEVYQTLLASTQQAQPIITSQGTDGHVDARLTGLLAHIRWLMNQNVDNRSQSSSRNNRDDSLIWRQIDSVMDDNSEDFHDLGDEFDTSILTVDSTAAIAGTLSVTGTTTLSNLTANSLLLPSITPVTTQNLLYNTAGELYWGGDLIAGGAVGNWASNGSDVYRLTGNIGIGTSTPERQFTIAGNDNQFPLLVASNNTIRAGAIFENRSTTNTVNTVELRLRAFDGTQINTIGNLVATDGNFASIHGPANAVYLRSNLPQGQLLFQVGGSQRQHTRMHISAEGNVGIGNPHDAISPARFFVQGAGSSTGLLAQFSDSTNTPRVTVLDNGNVGIGTSTPATKLHLVTDNNNDTLTIQSNSSGGFGPNIFLVHSRSGGPALAGDNAGFLRFDFLNSSSNQAFGARLSSIIENSNEGFETAGFRFSTRSQGTSVEAVRILGNGNVGIGTTTPSARLSVQGIGTTTGILAQFTDSANMPHVTILNNGNVGIGTASPLAKTHILNTTASNSFRVDDVLGDSTPFVIDANGNVGIGSSTPTRRLHVQGGSIDTLIRIQNGSSGNQSGIELFSATADVGFIGYDGGRTFGLLIASKVFNQPIIFSGFNDVELMRITGNGNIGLGTTTPSAQLTVVGTVRFVGITNGTLQADALGNITVSSDERLKDIEGVYDAGLEEILGLEPIQYNWSLDSGFDTETLYAGFSAQNVRDFLPAAVGENPDGFLTLSDRPILAALVNAVKEVWERLTGVESRVKQLEQRVLELEAALNQSQSRPSSSGGSSATEPTAEPVPPPASGDTSVGDVPPEVPPQIDPVQ